MPDKGVSKWVGLIVTIPAVVYFYLLYRYSLNFPEGDDFDALLNFLNHFSIPGIFAQHNEHRIVYDRLWGLVDLKLFGTLNFQFLMWIGSLSLIGTCYVLFIHCKKNILYFLPIPFLIFSISNYDNTFGAMKSAQNLTFICFVLGFFHFLLKPGKHNWLVAIFFSIATTFTSAAGVLLGLLGVLMLLFQKEKRKAVALLAVSLVIVFLYFYHYTHPQNHPPVTDSLLHPFKLIVFFSCFLGSFGRLAGVGFAPSFVFGLTIVFLYAYIALKKNGYKRNPFAFWSLTFLLGTSALAALTRSQIGGAVSSRYHIISLTVVCLLYGLVLSTHQKPVAIAKYMVYGSMGLWLIMLVSYMPEVVKQYMNKRKSMVDWHNQQNGLLYPDNDRNSHAKTILLESIRKKVFVPQ